MRWHRCLSTGRQGPWKLAFIASADLGGHPLGPALLAFGLGLALGGCNSSRLAPYADFGPDPELLQPAPGLLPDYMTSVKRGAFYGQHVDVRPQPQRQDLVASAIAPDDIQGLDSAMAGE